ncbi:MAG: hypothetical protein LBR15_05050 [Methanobrevibacter sp.]|nr:hypothetical protein [Candidatus Methanovirga australis]
MLHGDKGPKRDAILLNAGAGLYIGGKAETLKEGVDMANDIIASGKAAKQLDNFIDLSNKI